MYENDFSKRLYDLRVQKGVSARDMSLSIGQNAGYINNIENGKNLPSMRLFFYICEYLNITPCDFFNFSVKNPTETSDILNKLKKLNSKQLDIIDYLVGELAKVST